MNAMHQLLTDQIDIWTAAEAEKKSGRGRSSGNGVSVYGVKKLRELILQLAVMGKLVPQDSNNEPASELLKRIQAEKAKLIAEGKIKKGKPLPPITDEEKPFELPQRWLWVRLGGVIEVSSSKRIHVNDYVSEGVPFFRSKEIGELQRGESISTDLYISKEKYNGLRDLAGFPKTNDLMLTSVGSIGNTWLADGREFYYKDGNITKLGGTNLLVMLFVQYFIASPLFGYQVTDTVSGTAYNALTIVKLNALAFPLPPLEEQHRIVAKVDELMALCDQLETQHINAAEAHEKLVSHLLGTLIQSQNADDFSTNWQRIAAHFDTLFTTESSIDALKQTLLQLAVMGKLVPQDPCDEPANELLKRIQAEKAKLIAEGKIKKGKPLPPITEDEKPFELPMGWGWARMAEICRPISSGSTPSAENFRYEGGVPFLKVYNIRNQSIDFEYKKQFVEEGNHSSKLKRSIIYPGDVVMNIVGPPLGKVAIIPDSYPEWNCNQAIVFFGLIKPMSPQFILAFLKEGNFLRGIELIGTAGQDNISVTKSQNIPAPIPPTEEQHRIVVKVDELMAVCDQLKTRITEASQLQQKLADVVVEQAVSP